MKVLLQLFLLISGLSLFGCASNSGHSAASYQAEAFAFCDVFNPNHWQNTSKNDPLDIQRLLSERISSAVKSKEMQSIIDSMTKVDTSERYDYYIQEVRKLTMDNHHCSALKNYLSF